MVLEKLRSATRSAHARIEGVVKLLPEPTRPRYAWFLSKLYGFHEPLEARLAASAALQSALGEDIAGRRRVPLLVQDLRALGLDPAAQPLCRAIPDLGSVARALGVLYVVEGSTLGGQVLARRVQEALGVGASGGAAFLTGHGRRTRVMWEALCGRLEAFGAAQPGDVEELAGAAVDCFARMQRWFEEDA